MSAETGEILREARLARGIELAEVARATKINARYLAALEDGRWDELPGRAYVRGFLRTYAGYLGLDPQPILAEVEDDLAGPHKEEMPPESVVRPGVLGGGSSRRRRRLIGAGLAAALAAGAIALLVGGGDEDAGGPATTQAAEEAGEPGDDAGDPDAAPEPGAEPAEPEGERPPRAYLELAAFGDVWVCLVDGSGEALVNAEVLSAGDERGPFEARRMEITLGNGQIALTADGEEVDVPDAGQPLGYEITPGSVSELEEGERPTCA